MTADVVTSGLLGQISPGLVIILGALLAPIMRPSWRKPYMLALPIIAFAQLLSLGTGVHGLIPLFDTELVTVRIDTLSALFGYVFLLATVLGLIYQWHQNDWVQELAGLIYAGSAIGAVFAGDLVTLFLCWEGTAIASVFLIWAARTPEAMAAGQRYLIMQVGSGVLLLAGTMIHYGQTGSMAFESIDPATTAGTLMLVAIGIKAAFPLLHSWLRDAYPRATITGTVILSAFTTKLAIYALARGFAGAEILVPIGATMAIFPALFALLENDLRRVLAWTQIAGLGFMVAGIGIGTELAIGGAVAYAVCSVIYMMLLFMAIGAVMHRTGTARASDLGGLVRSMPWTTGFTLVGVAAASAVPLFSGFVAKALIVSAAIKADLFSTWIALVIAGAAVFFYAGLKVPYLAFFGRDSGLRPAEAPGNMRLAMGIAAAISVGIGLAPGALFSMLPGSVSYNPYSVGHVVTQLQMLAFAALAFALVLRIGIYPAMKRSTVLDTDWLWRAPARVLFRDWNTNWLNGWMDIATAWLGARIDAILRGIGNLNEPRGAVVRTRQSGVMAFWMALLLIAFLGFSFF